MEKELLRFLQERPVRLGIIFCLINLLFFVLFPKQEIWIMIWIIPLLLTEILVIEFSA